MIGQKSQFTTGNSTVELLKSLNHEKVAKLKNYAKMPEIQENGKKAAIFKNHEMWALDHKPRA